MYPRNADFEKEFTDHISCQGLNYVDTKFSKYKSGQKLSLVQVVSWQDLTL